MPRCDKTTASNMLCLGQIKGAVGLRGEVRLASFTQNPGDIASYGALLDASGQRTFTIQKLRPGKGDLIASFDGICDRTAAESLKGIELFIDRALLDEIEDEESWYFADLVGLKAVLSDGSSFGTVLGVHDFGAGELLDISLSGSKSSVFIPFTRAAVPKIDVPGGQLTIVPPEGLLEDKPRRKPGRDAKS